MSVAQHYPGSRFGLGRFAFSLAEVVFFAWELVYLFLVFSALRRRSVVVGRAP